MSDEKSEGVLFAGADSRISRMVGRTVGPDCIKVRVGGTKIVGSEGRRKVAGGVVVVGVSLEGEVDIEALDIPALVAVVGLSGVELMVGVEVVEVEVVGVVGV
jgi:hypothetical protein